MTEGELDLQMDEARNWSQPQYDALRLEITRAANDYVCERYPDRCGVWQSGYRQTMVPPGSWYHGSMSERNRDLNMSGGHQAHLDGNNWNWDDTPGDWS